jgi:hypothetical protein
MSDSVSDQQRYFRLLEKKLDSYYLAVLNSEPADQLNAELKGFLEAGMVLKVTSKDVLDAMIQSRYNHIRNSN